jgi:hypothetical protein
MSAQGTRTVANRGHLSFAFSGQLSFHLTDAAIRKFVLVYGVADEGARSCLEVRRELEEGLGLKIKPEWCSQPNDGRLYLILAEA